MTRRGGAVAGLLLALLALLVPGVGRAAPDAADGLQAAGAALTTEVVAAVADTTGAAHAPLPQPVPAALPSAVAVVLLLALAAVVRAELARPVSQRAHGVQGRGPPVTAGT